MSFFVSISLLPQNKTKHSASDFPIGFQLHLPYGVKFFFHSRASLFFGFHKSPNPRSWHKPFMAVEEGAV